MCGIIGYIGMRGATPVLLEGLKRMEYRGYDSAGVAVMNGAGVETRKAAGKISQLALPVIIPVTEFRDIYGVGLTNMIGGADPEAELKAATAQFEPVLAKSEG